MFPRCAILKYKSLKRVQIRLDGLIDRIFEIGILECRFKEEWYNQIVTYV